MIQCHIIGRIYKILRAGHLQSSVGKHEGTFEPHPDSQVEMQTSLNDHDRSMLLLTRRCESK